MSVLKEVTAISGKYTDKEGKEKNRYHRLGVILQTKNGPMLKVESIPVGWDGWAYINEPLPKDGDPPKKGASETQTPEDFDDPDLPF